MRVTATWIAYPTVPDGGPFENVFVRIMVTDGEGIRAVEIFDVEDTERALARFAELCAEQEPRG